MKLIETTDNRVSRDLESKALVASNRNELLKVRAARSAAKRVMQQTTDINGKISDIETRLINIEKTLTKFITHMDKYMGKPSE